MEIKTDLKKHLKIHSGDKYKCDLCDKEYTLMKNLNRHKKIHKIYIEERYSCDGVKIDCNKEETLVNSGQQVKKGKSYYCDFCCKEFGPLSRFKEHQRTHTGEKPFKCGTCDKQFTREYSLIRHTKIHGSRNKDYLCNICSKDFYTLKLLKIHLMRHTEDTESYYCDGVKIESDEIHTEDTSITNMSDSEAVKEECEEAEVQSSSDTESYSCDGIKIESDEIYTEDTRITNMSDSEAVKEESEEVEIQTLPDVESCDGVKIDRNKEEQVKEQKKEEKPFKCNTCDKRFSREYSLLRHTTIHGSSNSKSYNCKITCEICEKVFYKHVDLRRHQRRHTGEKPFKCDTCDKQFGNIFNLNRHKEIHLPLRKRPYKCKVCNKAYYRSQDLKMHLNSCSNKAATSCYKLRLRLRLRLQAAITKLN